MCGWLDAQQTDLLLRFIQWLIYRPGLLCCEHLRSIDSGVVPVQIVLEFGVVLLVRLPISLLVRGKYKTVTEFEQIEFPDSHL